MSDDEEARRRDNAKLIRIFEQAGARVWLLSTAHWRAQCLKLGIDYEALLAELGEEDDVDMEYYDVEQHLIRTYPGYEPCPEIEW